MSSFTPGPWHVADGENWSGISIRCGPPNERRTAMAKIPKRQWTGGKFEWDTEAEDRANASLIAAAPTLLAAALEALEFAEDQEDVADGSDGKPQPNKAMLLAQVLRAAVLKATGESA